MSKKVGGTGLWVPGRRYHEYCLGVPGRYHMNPMIQALYIWTDSARCVVALRVCVLIVHFPQLEIGPRQHFNWHLTCAITSLFFTKCGSLTDTCLLFCVDFVVLLFVVNRCLFGLSLNDFLMKGPYGGRQNVGKCLVLKKLVSESRQLEPPMIDHRDHLGWGSAWFSGLLVAGPV